METAPFKLESLFPSKAICFRKSHRLQLPNPHSSTAVVKFLSNYTENALALISEYLLKVLRLRYPCRYTNFAPRVSIASSLLGLFLYANRKWHL